MTKKGFLFLLILPAIGILLLALPYPSNLIPIDFFPNSLEPSTTVKIQGNEFKCLVDLGCGPALVLKEKSLNKLIQKKEISKTCFSDLEGNLYPTAIFKLSDLMIGNMKFRGLELLKDHDDFHFNAQFGSVMTDFEKKEKAQRRIDRLDGKIGWQAFLSYDCFIDFPNSALTLREKGSGKKWCSPKKFVSIPFTLDALGISISLESDSGIYRILLDTGASFSFIKKSIARKIDLREVEPGSGDVYFPSNKLKLGDCNYGPWEFGVYDISDAWKIDGCLGADFFLEYAVYLDFQNHIAYIQRPEKFFISAQWKRFKHRFTQICRKTWRM